MKPIGRAYQPLTEQELTIVKEYLESDKSLQEVADKHGISYAGLRYKIAKYRKECEINGQKGNQ